MTRPRLFEPHRLPVAAAVAAAVLLLTAAAAPAAAAAGPYASIVAFGDSFTDDGFADGAGFKRYTETLTWVERMSDELGIPLQNNAWGGAMSDQRNCNHPAGVEWSGLNWQVDQYLASLGPEDDISGILFTVLAGSNDAWSDIKDGAVTGANIVAAVEKLAARGAKTVLYVETPTVLLAPGYLKGDYAGYAEPWTKLVLASNAVTRERLASGLAAHPDLKIHYLRSDETWQKIKDGVEGYKFENLTDPWWGTYTMPVPGGHLWYDEWHPMGRLHEIAARDALILLGLAE